MTKKWICALGAVVMAGATLVSCDDDDEVIVQPLELSSHVVMVEGFKTEQQTTTYTSGPVAARMVMKFIDVKCGKEMELARELHCQVDSDDPAAEPGSARRWSDYGTSLVEMHDYFAGRSDVEIIDESYEPNYDPSQVITGVAVAGEAGVGNLPGRLTDVHNASDFIQSHVRAQEPVLVCQNLWQGHWTVIIGYDNGGTPAKIDDDLLVMADPRDTYDRTADGMTIVPLATFFAQWYYTTGPQPWQLHPFVVVAKKKK